MNKQDIMEIKYMILSNNEYHIQRSALLRCTFREASMYFSERSIDMIHIDGLHTYEAVKEDYDTWNPKLKEEGTLLFHDCNVRERNLSMEVVGRN